MSDLQPDELAELRRRVYGRGGDLRGNPEAMARLSALERKEAPQTEDASAGDARPTPGPDALEGAGAAAREGADRVPAVAARHSAPEATGRLDRKLRALWVASVLVAVIITALLVSWLHTPPGSEVAVLPLSDDIELPAYQPDYRGDALVTDDFHGLTAIYLGPDSTSQVSNGGCLQVVATLENTRVEPTFGCGAGPFPPDVALTVTPIAPDDLRETFPVGSTLRFVVDNDGDTPSVRVQSVGPDAGGRDLDRVDGAGP